MLNAIHDLGRLYVEQNDFDLLNILLTKREIDNVLSIHLIQDNNRKYTYDRIIPDRFDSENRIKYLYKQSSGSNGPDLTPSTVINSLDKSLKRFFGWFKKYSKHYEFIKILHEILNMSKEIIIEDLKNIFSDLEGETLLTLTIEHENKTFYLNDFDVFREILINKSNEAYYNIAYQKNIKGNGVCFLCDEYKEVYGLVSNRVGFYFSSPQKRGNVPNQNYINQWKLLPICGDCALYLKAGLDFIEEYLSFFDFELSYYVIPKFLFNSDDGFLELYDSIIYLKDSKIHRSQDIIYLEDDLEFIVEDLNDIIEFKFLFYEKKDKSFRILSYIESVIPSWLGKLYKTQNKISNYDFFDEKNIKKIFGEKCSGNFIEFIREIDDSKCSNKNWYKQFLKDIMYDFSEKLYVDLVSNIINNNKIDYYFLLTNLMNKIRLNWRNNIFYKCEIFVFKFLMLYIWLNELDLIKGEKNMSLENNDFEVGNMLNNSSKKTSFLLGVLTRKLINIQFKVLNSTPFYNRLWGLSLNYSRIRKLYPLLINKLREYGVTYADLEKEIAICFKESENNWVLNMDDTSFYFVLGYTLYDYYDESEVIYEDKSIEEDLNR